MIMKFTFYRLTIFARTALKGQGSALAWALSSGQGPGQRVVSYWLNFTQNNHKFHQVTYGRWFGSGLSRRSFSESRPAWP